MRDAHLVLTKLLDEREVAGIGKGDNDARVEDEHESFYDARVSGGAVTHLPGASPSVFMRSLKSAKVGIEPTTHGFSESPSLFDPGRFRSWLVRVTAVS